MDSIIRIATAPGRPAAGFYVVDSYAATFAAGVVAGPFDTEADARERRLDCNIAADCDIVEFVNRYR